MRPTKLVMSAFGPYADVTAIDFDALGTSGVYLVCGDTGAGKTMIFDAICFALFGEASGDSRGGARSTTSLRSDYAQGAIKTFVELSFEYRGHAYRIKRNPEYERPKDRGQGFTKQKADAEFEYPDGRVVTGVRKVNVEVEGLLGIDCEQFKQIVMLAQGEFRKLLTADTETRQGIFRKLFGTERYEMLQVQLAEECRKLERESVKVKERISALAQQARFPEEGTWREELEERRKSGGQLGAWLSEALEGLLATEEPAYRNLDSTVDDLRVKWSESNALLKQIETRPALEAERARLETDIAQLKAELPNLAEKLEMQKRNDSQRAKANERAAILEGMFPKYEELKVAATALSQAQLEEERAQQSLLESRQAHQAAGDLLEKLTARAALVEGADLLLVKTQAAYDEASAMAKAAKRALDDAKDLETKETAATEAAVTLERRRDELDGAAQVLQSAQEAQAEAQAKRDALSGAAAAYAESKASLTAAEQKLADAQALEQKRSDIAKSARDARKPYESSVHEFKKAETTHDADVFMLRDLQKRQRAGRAGLLAAELEEGKPCPVCGSVQHPEPASAHDSIPSDEELDAAAAKEAASAKAANELSLAAEGLKAVLDEREARLRAFDEEHGGTEGLQRASADAKSLLEKARVRYRETETQLARSRTAEEALKAAIAGSEAAKQARDGAQAAFFAARESKVAADTAAKALREALGTTDVAAATAFYEQAQARMHEAQSALGTAKANAAELASLQEKIANARTDADAAKTRLESAREKWQTQASELTNARGKIAHVRSDLEFSTIDEAKTEASRLRALAVELKAARDSAEQAVSHCTSTLRTKEELLKAQTKQLESIPQDDPGSVQTAMDEYHRRADQLKADAAKLKTRIDANRACLEGLSKALASASGLEERYGRVKLLADAATGNLAGQVKVRFEAYVQAIYFDKVIAAANERLKVLTSGQFELVRFSEGSGNAKAGLGLYVIDSFTGRARDASSLSGGESFQASLCLALGLSDIVQAHAGGIEFDTMFVDEGFGSLDQGALGNAISLLSDLSGETKLVGIISHVEDLKANIPKKLVVEKTRMGSSVSLEL